SRAPDQLDDAAASSPPSGALGGLPHARPGQGGGMGGHAQLQAGLDGPTPGAGCAQRGLGDTLSLTAGAEPGMDPRRRGNQPGPSPEAVEAVRDEWDRLADRTGAAPFLRPGWIEAWWYAFGAGRLEVLREEGEGRVRALLPVRHRYGAINSPSNWHSPG